ncbi:MAG: hypothetical protein QOF57_656 [Frankiaceae bacterium]|jgi:glucose-6-phosphate dehydrogenase assembly protein OpcA|nr:hypothetical protein [Frankiaceae bacterium]MDQ1726631.1 hypothetical protein [Frankiaceae bacterium]
MSTLWDTDASEIVHLLSAERRAAGAVASGIVLTLVTVVDEAHADLAIAAATAAAMAHPCRLLVVTRRQPEAQTARLDAEVEVGGRHGPGEAVVLRMYGRLCRHAESVVLPLLAPDTPVVTWWFGAPPPKPGQDPLGRLASRRITDSAAADDGVTALAGRAADYNAGDTDLAWTRLSPWRSILAAVFDTVGEAATAAHIQAEKRNPSAALLAAWLRARLGIDAQISDSTGPGITEISLTLAGGAEVRITRPDGRSATLQQSGQPDRAMPLPRRELGELLAEELQRLDADEPYADALAAFRRMNKRAAAS